MPVLSVPKRHLDLWVPKAPKGRRGRKASRDRWDHRARKVCRGNKVSKESRAFRDLRGTGPISFLRTIYGPE